jgi:outer membrane protein assembly factor BamB
MKIQLPFSILAAFALLVSTVARAEDWPQFRGPTGLGYSTEKDLPLEWGGQDKKNVLWSVPLKGQGHASPIVWKEQVIIANVSWPVASPKEMPKHFVTAYSTADGKELWSTEIQPGPWLRNDFRSGPGGGYAAPTPCTDGTRIYCLYGSAVMAALDMKGNIVWRKEIKPYTFDVTIGSSPVMHKDTIILLCAMAKKEDSRLVAFDKANGEVKWESKLPTVGFSHSTPVLVESAGKKQVIFTASGMATTPDALQSFDADTGKRLWWCKGAGDASSPAFADGLLYFDSGRGSAGTAVNVAGEGDVTDSHIKWSVGSVPEGIGSPIIVGGRVYRLHTPNVVKCWNLADGKQVFAGRLPDIGSTWASPIADASGRIYFASAGKSCVIEAGGELKILATNDLGDPNHASPAASNGRLFLLGEKKLYCVGK